MPGLKRLTEMPCSRVTRPETSTYAGVTTDDRGIAKALWIDHDRQGFDGGRSGSMRRPMRQAGHQAVGARLCGIIG
jgi:hypothetical protein